MNYSECPIWYVMCFQNGDNTRGYDILLRIYACYSAVILVFVLLVTVVTLIYLIKTKIRNKSK